MTWRAISYSDALAEGEKDKIIQHPSDNVENAVKTADKAENDHKPDTQTISNPQTEEETVPVIQESNSVPFPPISDPAPETQDYGPGKCVAPKPQGVYKQMNGVRGHHSPTPITPVIPTTSDSPRYIPPHKRPNLCQLLETQPQSGLRVWPTCLTYMSDLCV